MLQLSLVVTCCLSAITSATETVDRNPASLSDSSADYLSGTALFADVLKYAEMGEHRTGTEVDRATSAWLHQALASVGFTVSEQTFSLTQFFPERVGVQFNDEFIPAFPHWFPQTTAERGITAPLSDVYQSGMDGDLSGTIAYAAADQVGEWYKVDVSRLAETAAAKGALALIVAVPHPSGEIYVRNAAEPWLQTPLPIPTVVVASENDPALAELVAKGEAVTMHLQGREQTVTANNVVAKLQRGERWLVVSTPSSGWFQCAGERGGGIALWLGLARWIATQDTDLSILFIANSGHELSYMGAHHSKAMLPAVSDVALWLHLGASIAARSWLETEDGLQALEQVHAYNRLFSHPRWLDPVQAAFAEVPDLQVMSTELLPQDNGELVEYINAGYPALGLVGSHRFFHTPGDTAKVTSPALLAPYGQAVRRLLQSVLEDDAKSSD